MKGYLTFFIVLLALASLLFLSIYPPPSSSSLVAAEKARADMVDIGDGIENSAVEGAMAGIVVYVATVILELEPPLTLEAIYRAIDIEEMEAYAKTGAILVVQNMVIQYAPNYALFCYENEDRGLERAMIREKKLMIPREARHFSVANCPNSIDVDISLPSFDEADDLLSFYNKTFINVEISTNKEYGKMGIAYYDNYTGSASVVYMKNRKLSLMFRMPKEDILDMVKERLNLSLNISSVI